MKHNKKFIKRSMSIEEIEKLAQITESQKITFCYSKVIPKGEQVNLNFTLNAGNRDEFEAFLSLLKRAAEELEDYLKEE